jgi:hypothetical protein
MATAEDIRDIMRDEYPHLTPTIPEIGRVVKYNYFNLTGIYLTLDIYKDTIDYNRNTEQVTVHYKMIKVGSSMATTANLGLNYSVKGNNYSSWEYVDSA